MDIKFQIEGLEGLATISKHFWGRNDQQNA